MLLAAALAATLSPAFAQGSLRIATWHSELSRNGPGLLLRDILKGKDTQIAAALQVLVALDADIVVLQGVDHDHGGQALTALAEALATAGAPYPHHLSLPSNAGRPTGLDMDGDGRLGEPEDAQSHARFEGQGATALLSRHPILRGDIRDFSQLLWRDLPGAALPAWPDGQPFPSPEAQAIQRLATNGLHEIPIALPDGTVLRLLTFHASPPAFEGPEQRNTRRNHDEALFWLRLLDGTVAPPPQPPFVLAGNANLEAGTGTGRPGALSALLAHPQLRDPHAGMGPTVDWTALNLGKRRVSYLLPGPGLAINDAGLAREGTAGASRHIPLWVDVTPLP